MFILILLLCILIMLEWAKICAYDPNMWQCDIRAAWTGQIWSERICE